MPLETAELADPICHTGTGKKLAKKCHANLFSLLEDTMADTKDVKNKENTRSYSSGRNIPTHYRREPERSGSTDVGRYSSFSPFYSNSPFSLIRRMADDMDRMFSDFGMRPNMLGSSLTTGGGDQSMWAPQIETFRRGDNLVVRADLPGMNKENVNVEIEDDMLILSGERQDEYKEEKDDYYRSERSYGRFYRAIPLPDGVDPNACNAQFRDGVLEVNVTLPKEAERKTRRIDIK
jgi:HSP20 family protein